MKAIILAAGMGNRISKLSDGLPKSMFEFGNSSIIHFQIEQCLLNNINNFVIVLGYKYDILKSHVLEILSENQVQFVRNDNFAKTNTLYSLWLARDYMKEDFVYFNADVLFHPDLLKKISKKSKFSELLLETKSCAEEEVKMILDENMKVLEIGKKLRVEDCAGEFIGIGKFNNEINNTFIKYLQYGVDNGQQNNYFEYAVNLLVKEETIIAVPTDDLPCIEIDFPEDLIKARNEVFPEIHRIK